MSERRKVGDKVVVRGRRGAEAYVCLIPNGHGNKRQDKCIHADLNVAFDRNTQCSDQECKEWSTLKILKVLKPTSDHYAKKEMLCHVSECEMVGAKGGHG